MRRVSFASPQKPTRLQYGTPPTAELLENITPTLLRLCLGQGPFDELVQAVTQVQSWMRGISARRHAHQRRNAATYLQSTIRGMIERQQAREIQQYHRKRREAVVRIQAIWRRVRQCQWYHRQQKAAVTMQAVYRGFAAKEIYQQVQYMLARVRMCACVRIQATWRAYVIRKPFLLLQYVAKRRTVSMSLQVVCQSILILQAHCRRYRAVQQWQTQRRGFVQCQRLWREYQKQWELESIKSRRRIDMAMQQITELWNWYEGQHDSIASRVGMITHGWLVLQILSSDGVPRQLSLPPSDDILLARTWREYVEQSYWMRALSAAVLIQTQFRRYRASCRYQLQRKQVLQLQACVRGYYFGRQEVEKLVTLSRRRKWAAVCLASCLRRLVKQRQWTTYRKAVIRTQSWSRKVFARRSFTRCKFHAVVLQTMFRRRQAIQRVNEMRALAKLRRCIIEASFSCQIQRYWRGYSTRRIFNKVKEAAITIQCLIRKVQAKFLLARRRWAAKSLQAVAQAYLTRRKLKLTRLVTTIQSALRRKTATSNYYVALHAIVLIQANIRRHSAASKFAEAVRAIVLIQANIRRHSAASKYAEAVRAIVLIQANTRRHSAATKYAEAVRAIVLIQASMRRHSAATGFQRHRKAVIQLQSMIRKYLDRSHYQTLRSRHHAAIRLETFWRRVKAQQQFTMFYSASVIIQTAIRQWQATQGFNKQRRAAVNIQASARRLLCRRCAQARRSQMRLQAGATTIQSAWRRFVSEKLLLRAKASAIVIQTRVRSRAILKHLRLLHTMVTKIQAVIRAHMARQYAVILREIRRIKLAVICIQNFWHHFVARRHMQLARAAAIRIQDALRDEETRKQHRSAERIQAVVRGHLYRLDGAKVLNRLKEYGAATQIANTWRCSMARKRLISNKSAAIRIQSMLRVHRARKQYQKAILALVTEKVTPRVTLIQSHWLRFAHRRVYLFKWRAAVMVQSVARMRLSRRYYISMKAAVITIQTSVRQRYASKMYRKAIKAIILIQSCIRCILAQKRCDHMHTRTLLGAASMFFEKNWTVPSSNSETTTYKSEKFSMKRRYVVKPIRGVKLLPRAKKVEAPKPCPEDEPLRSASSCDDLSKSTTRPFSSKSESVYAMLIQSTWRGLLAREKENALRTQALSRQPELTLLAENSINLNTLATRLQKNWRRQKDRNVYRLILSKLVRVQRQWRIYMSKKAAAEIIRLTGEIISTQTRDRSDAGDVNHPVLTKPIITAEEKEQEPTLLSPVASTITVSFVVEKEQAREPSMETSEISIVQLQPYSVVSHESSQEDESKNGGTSRGSLASRVSRAAFRVVLLLVFCSPILYVGNNVWADRLAPNGGSDFFEKVQSTWRSKGDEVEDDTVSKVSRVEIIMTRVKQLIPVRREPKVVKVTPQPRTRLENVLSSLNKAANKTNVNATVDSKFVVVPNGELVAAVQSSTVPATLKEALRINKASWRVSLFKVANALGSDSTRGLPLSLHEAIALDLLKETRHWTGAMRNMIDQVDTAETRKDFPDPKTIRDGLLMDHWKNTTHWKDALAKEVMSFAFVNMELPAVAAQPLSIKRAMWMDHDLGTSVWKDTISKKLDESSDRNNTRSKMAGLLEGRFHNVPFVASQQLGAG